MPPITTRRRPQKGPVISSDDEDTFINNSDYVTPENKAPNITANDSISGLSDSLQLMQDAQGGSVTASSPHSAAKAAVSSPTAANITNLSPVSSPRGAGSPSSAAIPSSEFKVPSSPRASQLLGSPKVSSPFKLPALNEVTNLPPFPADKGLSYSQQQASVTLHSPSKRRETLSQPQTKENTPRLVIQRLVLTNFKSYAGVQEIGPFNASFSAVVGPNGSGKSNVIDSMLFVFGFRALKMRQSKLSELIHNSAGGAKLDFCQVDIHFVHVLDDAEIDNKSDVVPGSELVISRKATKNNQSQYYINGRTSNYTEVTDYLRGQGIDLDHKRFLILQGEVESIAQMKAKAERENDDGLLEYLEDIIGTTGYKLMIEQNSAKAEELNEVCAEKENRFELVEKDKNLLEEKKADALKFLEMEKRLTNKRSVQYQVSIHENKRVLAETESVVADLSAQLQSEKEKNKVLNDGIKEFKGKKNEVAAFISDLDKQHSALLQKQKAVKKSTVSTEEKIKNLSSKAKKIEKTKLLLELALTSSTLKLASSNSANLHYKNELAELNGSLETEKKKLDDIRRTLTTKTAGFSKEIEVLKTKLEPWNDKLKDKEGAIQLVDSYIEMIENQKANIEKQLTDARQRLIDIKLEGKEKEAEFVSSENKLKHVISQMELGEQQVNEERLQHGVRKAHLSSMRQKTQDAVNAHSKVQNQNQVLASLMRLAKSGRIDGFYGRLGDLGQIDDKYDVAISTAAPGLDSMVVETVETAQACIEYLRKNRLGYANFVCLDKLRSFDLRPISTPGNPTSVKRLFDLITAHDPKFLPAFYSKLYNTLVASNLQEAKSVAYGAKRWKVVTLDGKVVDTSGTMSGGGNYAARGGMKLASNAKSDSSDYTDEDIQRMQDELNKLESKYDLSNREFQEKEHNLRKLQDLKPDLEFKISRLKLDIEALSSEKKEILKRCKALIADSENSNAEAKLESEIKTKQDERTALIHEKDALREQMSDSESQISALEEKILEAGGVELRIQNSKVDSIKQLIEIIHEKTAGDVMAIKKLENDIKRHTKIIADSETELQVAEEELSRVQEQLGTKAAELGDLDKQLSELQNAKEEKDEELETIKAELEERSKQINDLKSTEIEIENTLEQHNAVVRKCKKHIEADEQSLRDLVVRDVTEYIDWLEEEEQSRYNGALIEQLSGDEIAAVRIESVEDEINSLEEYMNTVKVDIEVLKEYGKKIREFESRRTDLNEAVEKRDEIKNYCEDLKRKRLEEFMEGFNTISMSLKEMYQMITMGGNAELELVDSLDPFSEGILFSVMPPKKSWKNISNLSGGEKTLSSLALVFALHKYKPTPLYVMDEIDAALDFRNVSIVANYIKERTKNGQFIVISLRNNMFELAQQLVGIYKVNNMTRSISLQNKDFFVPDKPSTQKTLVK